MPDISCVLAIGGHAADMEFTAGALVAKYTRAGARAVFLHLTAGEMGHPRLSGQEYARQKYEEAHNAARVLGAEARFLPPRAPATRGGPPATFTGHRALPGELGGYGGL